TITIDDVRDVEGATASFCFDEQEDTLLSTYDDDVIASGSVDVAWFRDFDRLVPATSTGGALSVGPHYFYATVENGDGCTSEAMLDRKSVVEAEGEDVTGCFCIDEQEDRHLRTYDAGVCASGTGNCTWLCVSDRRF